ncbi:hypothetical protein [Actinomadura rupiterrae]|uniref:hypothetical protein n=1 Tax=Actinomadura rupiterrae TaxID=559627 RepID=UPI0020A3CD65|nr:hypothetical protein [Actinomadura rupiterrae]MCP2338912.1 hypothetical protein [Actinomadura rupiterrae]
MPEWTILTAAAHLLRERWRRLRTGPRDGGYTTETVVVTALLVALAIAAVALIAGKVRAKAGGLDLG